MPRRRTTRGRLKAEVLNYGLVASGRNLTTIDFTKRRPVRALDWENQAWYWYDTIEAFHYAVQWVGNLLSKAKLLVLENGEPTKNPVALALLESFFGGQHAEFLRQAGIHMTVAGEGYIVGIDDGAGEEWCVAAATKTSATAAGWRINNSTTADDITFVMRFWRPHPVDPRLSDSPTRPLLPILSQLDELTKYVSAQLESRLSNAGILLMPQEAVLTGVPGQTPVDTTNLTSAQAFLREMAETMAVAMEDQGSAAARVPFLIQMPGDLIDKAQFLTIWTNLDEHAAGLRDETLRRMALGLDMPPEILTGTGDVNHWGAWEITDAGIKAHSEPLLAILIQAVTSGYLQPMLMDSGMDEEATLAFEIGADDSEMRLQPDRSKQAAELYDRGELSAEAMRRENGFEESDAPDDNEKRDWLAKQIAQGSATPDQVAYAAKAYAGLDLPEGIQVRETISDRTSDPKADNPEAQTPQEIGIKNAPQISPPPSNLDQHPQRTPPEKASAALMATAEAAVFRALERAGNRIKSTSAKLEGIPGGVPAMDRYRYVKLNREQLNFVLEDAWSTLDRFTAVEDVAKFEADLDNYTRMLISSRQPYDRDLLSTYLNLTQS